MIKLIKIDKPEVLKKNATKWTEELLSYTSKGKSPPDGIVSRYRHKDIKDSIEVECFGKCVYCGSFVSQIYWGDVEHIKPKSKYPELTYEWNNLTFVCAKCNSNKSDDFDENLPFVNPYNEEPLDYLMPLGSMIFPRNGNKRGEITIKGIQLNRPELIERRSERLTQLQNLVDKYKLENNTTLKKILLEEIKREIGKDKQYSMCSKAFIESYLNDK